MDCNKDEAIRAKEIAEKKFVANDIAGAKRFASKANSLYPGLSGVSQMIATLEVYVAAENKIDGEADWYGVLGVDSRVDVETMRKQYRKMALTLHPDKNKSVGADGAFKLVSEAWKLLSDKGNRAAYDQRRKAKAFPTASTPAAPSGTCGSKFTGGSAASSGAYGSNKSTRGGSATSGAHGPKKSAKRGSSTSATANGSKNSSGNATSTASSRKHSTPANQPATPAPVVNPKPQTFWTVCYRCKIRYEYLRLYLNYNILCPCCHQPFAAIETAPPSFDSKPLSSSKFPQQQQNASHGTKGKSPINGASELRNRSCSYTCYEWNPVSKTFCAKVAQQSNERVKRGRDEAEAATNREDSLRRKV